MQTPSPIRRYNLFHRVVQAVTSTAWGAKAMSFMMHHFDRRVYQWTNGRATLGGILSGLPVIMVTTTGAKTGQPRTVPLLCIPDEEGVFSLIASNWGQKNYPAWYYNLKANLRAKCKIDGVEHEYAATEAEGEEYERWWKLAEQVYVGYPKYEARTSHRRIPIMVMRRVDASRTHVPASG